MERRSTPVSIGMALLLGVQAVTLLLFVFNADRMASRFVGAMCAVGTLRVNSFGFPALLTQVAAFLGSSVWLTMNAVDTRCRDYPLARAKSVLLLSLVPLLALSFGLELAHFLGLEADVITSCCATMFSPELQTVVGSGAGWPVRQAMPVYFVVLGAAVLVATRVAWRGSGGLVLGISGLVAFAVSLAAVVAFVSPYVFEDPRHHCPFCLLKSEYGYRGYALFVPLFAATAASLGAAALAPFGAGANGSPDLAGRVRGATRALASVALAGFLVVLLLTAREIAASRLTLLSDGRAKRAAPWGAPDVLITLAGMTQTCPDLNFTWVMRKPPP